MSLGSRLKLLGKSSLQKVIPGQYDMEKPLGDNCAYLHPWRTLEIILPYDRIPRPYLTRCSFQMFKNKCPVSLKKKIKKSQKPHYSLLLAQHSCLTKHRHSHSKQSIFRSPDEWPYGAGKRYGRAAAWWHPANCCPTRYIRMSRGCQVTELFIRLLRYSNYLKYFQKQRRASHKLPSWYSTRHGRC